MKRYNDIPPEILERTYGKMRLELAEVSICSGIKYNHLVMMLKGMMEPSEAHLTVLKRTLNNDDYELFNRPEAKRKAPNPTIDSSKVPDGYVLIPYCPYDKLLPGDLLAYNKGSGYISWIEISEKDPDPLNKIVYSKEDNEPIYITGGRPVRVARKKENNT